VLVRVVAGALVTHSGPELRAPIAMQLSLNAACVAQRRACLAHWAAEVAALPPKCAWRD